MQSISPHDESIIGEVPIASASDYEKIISEAEKAFLIWRNIPAPKRGDIIRQIGDIFRKNKSKLGDLIHLEMGKSREEAYGEVQELIDIADFAVGQSRMLYGKTMHSERANHRMYEQWHPYGIIGVITAFNFPVAVWAWNTFIAAICGNVVLWKPSSETPLCAIFVQNLCNQVLLENKCPAIFHLFITNSHKTAELMLDDKKIPVISFTGSTKVGREVSMRVAKRLGKTILELGGNNGVIITPSANLDLAIEAVVFGSLGTAGQRCTTTRRLFIHKSLYKKIIKSLIIAYKNIPTELVGPLINKKAVENFENAIMDIKNAGGQILYGGEVVAKKGFFVLPTLVDNLSYANSIVKSETFAPILYIFAYDTLRNAIEMHNAVPQGLSSSIFTQDLKEAEYFLSSLGSDCGIANVNIGTSGAEIGGAFGGEKDTGGGREAGSDAWQGYMRRQTNTINWGDYLPLAQGIEYFDGFPPTRE